MLVPALVAALFLSACGGGSSGGAPSSSGSPTGAATVTTRPTLAPAPTAPADTAAATKEISTNWTKFFASGTKVADAKDLLEQGNTLGPALRKAQQEDRQTGGSRSADVKSVEFTSPTQANVTYTLHIGTQELPASGVAVLEDGTWKVSKTTFCTLVELGNNQRPVRGCSS